MNLPDFSQTRLLIVGDLMLDRYWKGSTARISPEAPVPVVKVGETEDRPGGAANVAINAATLGAQVTLMGLVGEDEAAATLQQRLEAMSVDCCFSAVAGFDTITKLRIVSRNQQLLRLDFEKDFSSVDKQTLYAQFSAALAQTDVVVLSDYAKGCLSDPQAFIQLARERNIPVVVDPKGTDFDRYRGATLLTPNMSEFEAVTRTFVDEPTLTASAAQVSQQLSLDALLITRSEKGMSLFTQNASHTLHLPAKAREVYDVTGAGDTVVSTLAACLAAGETLPTACVLANIAASIVVGKLGTSTVTTTELALALRDDHHPDGGVMSRSQLISAVRNAQVRGEKVVMTNGCFDILHAGHVAYLNEAAKLGQRLIVAVNTDESVRALKGAGRPINSIDRRMAVLAGLASVDWVVPFAEETPRDLIAAVLPDVLVKGGDYKIEDIAGGKEVMANGGEVKVLLFEEGVSTTAIIRQIVETN
ncbi:bifunctional D-glycero-beta-D-manno-heptose-7-phosphate kinase/D-glycero-beta-D-manno-heptose 1-phosphate adenylyltransferase HldE [Alteromonas oceanisediminis]|uniref:bifunctional D-glycero-beta-D-manno-heptose-7-phosphate kinase/D-glycero-beta-D-manno-heptose 1-phosphate adenylyltransferase HldE n=1 Tax=Alteromonas oceanisediminis TaxID=2836180 RepID=UPI001BDA695B|nr:bifunctional D-glycero-beta-D-manno-heptose-7-phosphate kinase/D-glycero-beta-D-manno-heptose 1-phosphate adenylyltransferase HldE [Alteromonas oceanisediminis]MBT0585655.1 bifunctional D-glycero-beta-D-manno-heptose-7-phosphate kinase/D-glycero-beta-D-manno-heptose 1-phosphate adenylyltransferase HldE [Alteromonas oceanisediminis]